MASETDELRRACDRWVAEATVERRSADQRKVWPPARRARRALDSAPLTPTKKSVAVVKGTVALFCPQPSTPSASVAEPSASVADDPYTETAQRRAPLSAVQRASAELAAARMMQKLATVDEKQLADGDEKQLVDGDDKQLVGECDEKQLVESDEKQLVEGDEKQLDELHVARDPYQQSDAEYRLAEKRADADFPPWIEPWQDRSSPPAPSDKTRQAPPAKTQGAPPGKRQRWTPNAPRACAVGAKPQPAKKQQQQRWTHTQWMNWKTGDDDWREEFLSIDEKTDGHEEKKTESHETKTAWPDEKKTDWHDDEKKTDWHDEEKKTDWHEEKKTDWHASNTMWHEEKKTDWHESKTDGHDEEKKTDWYDEANKTDWASMMDAAIARWRTDGHTQAANTGRRVKRRAGAKIQEQRKLLASEPATIQALKRATAKEASHRDLDLLFRTFGPQALEELLAS
jgi:hypothetical protein